MATKFEFATYFSVPFRLTFLPCRRYLSPHISLIPKASRSHRLSNTCIYFWGGQNRFCMKKNEEKCVFHANGFKCFLTISLLSSTAKNACSMCHHSSDFSDSLTQLFGATRCAVACPYRRALAVC